MAYEGHCRALKLMIEHGQKKGGVIWSPDLPGEWGSLFFVLAHANSNIIPTQTAEVSRLDGIFFKDPNPASFKKKKKNKNPLPLRPTIKTSQNSNVHARKSKHLSHIFCAKRARGSFQLDRDLKQKAREVTVEAKQSGDLINHLSKALWKPGQTMMDSCTRLCTSPQSTGAE